MTGRFLSTVSLVLLVIGAGVLFSGCAIGFRGPASHITATGATLNGSVASNRSEQGEWFFKYGKTDAYGDETPHRSIDFTALEGQSVSEPVSGLEPGNYYHYALCAKDQEPGVAAFCSHDQTVRPDYYPWETLTKDCSAFPPAHGVLATLTGFPPNTLLHRTLDFPDGTSLTSDLYADANGDLTLGPYFSDVAGTWKDTIEWLIGSTAAKLETGLVLDCQEGSLRRSH